MNILVKYIAQEFTKFFCLFLFGFVIIILIGNLFSRLGNVFSSVEHFLLFLQETVLLLPGLVELILPITTLLATIATFNLLNRTSEMLAMRTIGMGFFQLARPVFAVVLVIALLNYLSQNYLYNWLENQFATVKTLKSLSPLWKIKQDNIYYFGVRHLNSTVEQIAIFSWVPTPYRVSQRTMIEMGEKKENRWHLKNIRQRQFSPAQSQLQQQSEAITPLENFPAVSFEPPLDPHQQPLWTLFQNSIRLQQEGLDSTKHWVEFYQKLAYPFTLLIMVLIGLALSLSHSRQGKAAESMALSCLLGIFFWITNQIFIAIGNAGVLSPFLATWLSNLVFFSLALFLVRHYRP